MPFAVVLMLDLFHSQAAWFGSFVLLGLDVFGIFGIYFTCYGLGWLGEYYRQAVFWRET